MKKFFLSLALLTGAILFTSCEDDDIQFTEATLDLAFSSTTTDSITISSGEYTFKDVTTGLETKLDAMKSSISLAEGTYNVTFIGKGSYTVASTDYEVQVDLQGSIQNVVVIGESISLELELIVIEANREGDFVFAELFLAGTLKPDNKQYNGDQYIILHNNSNKVLYADQLILIESKFLTNKKYDYTPNIMKEAMAVHGMFMIPGKGTEHPVNPGENFIICDNAMNHKKEANPNSTDLSTANFEWHSDLSTVDIDNPNVPNLENLYLSAGKFWMASKQGNKAYVIGRLPENMTKESYLEKYKYDYEYELSGKPRPQTAYKFPNEWIVDAVNISPNSTFAWSVLDQSLDLGYTSLGETSSTTENMGKAVIRKKNEEKSAEQGRLILLDKNNSGTDFNASQKASLLAQ